MKSMIRNQKLTGLITAAGVVFCQSSVMAQTATPEPVKKSVMSNPVFVSLLAIIILLLIVIVVFARVASGAVQMKIDELKKKQGLKSVLLVGMLLASISSWAQAVPGTAPVSVPAVAPAKHGYFGLDAGLFITMLAVILFELIAIRMLYVVIMEQLGVPERREQASLERKVKKVRTGPTVMERLNQAVPLEREKDILLDHNYDGIRELDNNLPPWWKYGFYASIVFAIIYLVHYHVTRTGPLQEAEYNYQMYQAKLEIEAYKAKAANLVDETNATLLTDPAELAAGKSIYKNNCVACHGASGEGGVGPNLTDEYWLHGGDIKDVFKTVKYGYAEKGMKAWEQDLGAKQIHEVASYIETLRGTNPPNGKEPQGELYKEPGK